MKIEIKRLEDWELEDAIATDSGINIYRVQSPPPERLRLATAVGDFTVFYYAYVYKAEEVMAEEPRGKLLCTYWTFWCTLPGLLPGAHIGRLRTGQRVTLPMGGTQTLFKVQDLF